MRVIGLTGGIASGKSAVARHLTSLGAVVIDADLLARDVVQPGEDAYRAIVAHFGRDILQADGSLDRKALGRIVFADPGARKVLEAITHPAIARLAAQLLGRERDRGTPVVFYMVPLLFEAGLADSMDEIWVVSVDEKTQLARLMARDAIDRDEALRKVAAQQPLAEKAIRAHVVIDNNGLPEQTASQVEEAWQTLQERLALPAQR